MSGRVTENVCVNMEVFCWCQHGGIQLTESRTYAQPLLPAAGSRAMRDTEPLPSLTGWLWRSLSFAEQVLPPILLCTCSCTHDDDGDEAASSTLLCSGLEGSLHRKQHAPTEEASWETPFSWLPFPNSLCSKDHSALLGLLGSERGRCS